MNEPKALPAILRIAKYTMADEIRQRSLLVMFAIFAMFVFLVRGCYQGNYMVNGQWLDAVTIAWNVSKAAFHVIAVGAMFITALLSMRVFKRDRDHGMQACILSKPIDRRQYVMGKVLGLWSLSMLFMFILHGIVFVIASINMDTIIPDYLIASLLCSLNLFFVVIAVLLLSLLLPDIIALLCVIGIGAASWMADGIYFLSNSQMVQAAMQPGTGPISGLTLWKIVYYLWPKLSGTQLWASSMIGREEFHGYGSLYPFVNVLLYCLMAGLLLLWRFKNEEIV